VRDEGQGPPTDVTDPLRRFDLFPSSRGRSLAPAERLVLLLSALLLLASLVGVAVHEDEADETAAPGAGAGPAPPPAPPVLLAQQEASGRASSITVLVPSGSGGGTVVFVPPGTMTEVVSLGLEPVGRSLELGGPPRLQATVENLLGVRLGGITAVDDPGLSLLLRPAGPLSVDVPERVEQVRDGGRVEVLYPAGRIQLDPADAPRFLAVKGRTSDLARLARHQAFWESWLAALRRQPAAVPAQPPELGQAVAALVRGEVRSRVLPVESFGAAGEEGELYRVREAEVRRLVAGVFPPTARPGAGERPRVQILNGTGAVGLAEAVRNRIGPAYDVRFTGNAATFDQERTQVVFYRPSQMEAAQRLRDALGVGELVRALRPLDVVDVTVVVGRDFRP